MSTLIEHLADYAHDLSYHLPLEVIHCLSLAEAKVGFQLMKDRVAAKVFFQP